MSELRFTSEPMSIILPLVQGALAQVGRVSLQVPHPDLGMGKYAGEHTSAGLHRPWSSWADLADLLGAHLLAPEKVNDNEVRLSLVAYAPTPEPDAAGYQAGGDWQRVDKLEDPVFLLTFIEALRRVNPPSGGRVLALGVNTGRELSALKLAFPESEFEVVGVDLDASAVAIAQERYPQATFLEINAMHLPAELGQFDLIVALSLLQSPGVRQDVLLSRLRKHHLTPLGGLVLGFPNARYRDGFLSYGARMRNYARPDLSLLCADVTNARRGLQKHGYKVYVTGKYEVLVTAIPAHCRTPEHVDMLSK